ncbi:MAG TPA: hypothetical protein V6D06_11820 [Trichocoleus sp.]
MTTGGTDRLDRVEALLAQIAESQARTQQNVEELSVGLRETRAIADSNARAVQAWESRIEEGIADAEEVSTSMAASTNEQLSSSITDTVAMISDLGRQQAETDQRFNILLEEARADRREWRQHREESSQQFNTLIEEARADRQEWRQKFDEQVAVMQSDRQSNANQFEAALELIRGLFLEIQELWREFRAG